MSHPAAAAPHRPGALALAIEHDDWERASLLILLAFSRTVRRMPPARSTICSLSSQSRTQAGRTRVMHDESAVADHAPAPNFYASVLDEAELAEASATAGVDSELAMMRVQLRRRLRDQPDEYALLLKSTELIVRTVAARYRMSAKRSGEFSDTMGLAVKYVGEQLFPERFADV